MRGEIPVNREISLEMNRIDGLIANPGVYYDDSKVEGWIKFCEQEMTLTDGSDLHLLDSFKLWGEQIFGWWYFVDRNICKIVIISIASDIAKAPDANLCAVALLI